MLLNVKLDLCTLYKISILKLNSKVGRIEHYITGIKFGEKNQQITKSCFKPLTSIQLNIVFTQPGYKLMLTKT